MCKNKKLLDRLHQVECQDSTYSPISSPLVFEKGRGSLVYDAEGKEYIDLCAGFGALSLGHNPDELSSIYEARIKGVDEAPPITHGLGDVYPSRAKVELLEKLVSLLPSHLTRGSLALSGSHAVETAVKTTLLATGRSTFISFSGGYHGVDLGVLPLTSREDFKAPFSSWLRPEVVTLPFMCDRTLLEAAVIGKQLAGVIIEPIQGRAGVYAASSPWLSMLREFTWEQDALLIFDEVFTGLGRSGRMTYAEEIECDLLCLGKGLGSGLPVSACVGTEKVMSSWPRSEGEAIHTGTFFGHPLCCEAGVKTLDAINDQNLCARSKALGEEAKKFLKDKLSEKVTVSEIRGQGLMLGVSFNNRGLGARLMDELRENGVLALAAGAEGECLSITPALNISKEHLFKGLSVLVNSAG